MTEISINDLAEEDRRCVEAVSNFADSVLTEEKVDEYISSKIIGTVTQAMCSEMLKPFIKFLQEQAEYHKVDMIIDSYEKENRNG